MCSVPCVRKYFQLCQSVTTQILLDRKGVVYLNSSRGFGSTELKLTVCINSVFFWLTWPKPLCSQYLVSVSEGKGLGRKRASMSKHLAAHLVPTGIRHWQLWNPLWGLRPARNRWDPSDRVESLPKWRDVTDWYKLRNKGKIQREIIACVKGPFGCMELLYGRDRFVLFLFCGVGNITTIGTPSCHFSGGKVE